MNKNGIKLWRISFALVALGIAFVMCAGGFNSMVVTASEPKMNTRLDDYFYVGMQDEPKSLNPVIPNDVWSSNFLGWLWDGTISRDPDDQSLQPWIATDWHMVQDGTNKNFTVHYRFGKYDPNKEIKFTDGHQVDIYDLLFTFELAMKVPRWSSGYESLDKSGNGTVTPPECTDTKQAIHLVRGISMDSDPALKDHTLHFFLNRTDASWEINYVSMVLYPYHLWKDKFYAGQFNDWNIELETLENQRKFVVGSGAFKYNEWKKGGQYAQLDTNKDYFPWNKMPRDKDGNPPPALVGKDWHWEVKKSPVTIDPSQTPWGDRSACPYIAGLKYKIYFSVDTAILALLNGDVDANWWTVDPGYLPQLQANKDIQLVTSEDTGFFYAAFNMRKPAFGYEDWNNPVVDKGKAFRKAFLMCTDKDTIVKRLLMNYGTVGSSVISPSNTEWFNPYVKTVPFDPAGAKKVLEAAGIKKASNGFYDLGDPVGSSPFDLLHPPKDYDSVRYEAARMIVEQLYSIGVNIHSKPLQFGQVVERMNARNFDVYILGWRLGLEPDYMYDFFHSSQSGQGLNNHPGYHNSSYDSIVDQSRAELNRAKRVDLIKQAQAIIAEDMPYDVLYYRSNIEAYRQDRWSGWVRTSGGIMNGWSFNFLKKPTTYMGVKVEPPKIITSERTGTINIKVSSMKDGSFQAGAEVTVTVSSSPGTLPGGFGGTNTATAITNTNGIASFTYTAPLVNASEINRTITVQATASKTGFELSRGSNWIKVYSDVIKYYVAKIDVAASTLTGLKVGESGTVRINVEDQVGSAAAGVAVAISVEPSTGITLSKKNATTDSSGKILLTFTADTKGNYTLIVEPVKTTGIEDVVRDTTVINVLPPPPPPPPPAFPLIIVVVIIVVIVVVIAVVAVVVMRKRAI